MTLGSAAYLGLAKSKAERAMGERSLFQQVLSWALFVVVLSSYKIRDNRLGKYKDGNGSY